MTEYFFDTYAILEIFEKNPRYKKYLTAHPTLTKLNLFELCYAIARRYDRKRAITILRAYLPYTTEFDWTIIGQAAFLRLQHKKRRLSMTDCIGYCHARAHKMKFLTGDVQFKDMENVEFVA